MERSRQTFERTTFEMSQAADYFTPRGLQAMTGQPLRRFMSVVIKELLDNAIDACESAGVAPSLTVTIESVSAGCMQITVADNGPGIPPVVVRQMFNFDTRTSDKAAYRSPTRGAQGNALKTILGIPCALGLRVPLLIEAQTVQHTIHAWTDPAGVLHASHDEAPVPYQEGTRVTITLSPEGQECDLQAWGAAFALFNPHTSVKICQGRSREYACIADEDCQEDFYLATVDFPATWRKYVPNDATSIWWYSVEDLKRLVFLRIAQSQDAGTPVLLREFVKEFRNLSANASAQKVCRILPTLTRLSDFTAHESAVGTLHGAMRDYGKPPSAAILGTVGRGHFEACFAAQYGVKRFWYATKDILHNGMPFIVEVAIAETVEGGGFFTGVNFSPTFNDPLPETWLSVGEVIAKGLRNFLHAAHVLPYNAQDQTLPQDRAVAVHLICPALEFLDRGKTQLAIPWWMENLIATTLWSAGKALYREEEQRKKDVANAERQAKARQQAERDAAAREAVGLAPEKHDDTLADAVFAVMQDAWVHATGDGQYRISARGLFYAVRDRIQPLTARKLEFKYFGKLVPQYQREVAPLVGLYYEQRGVLYEPHTGTVVHLGTCEVEAYVFPAWRYDKILYVEKRTVWPALQDARLAERYDMAIVTGEGYATEAIRVLFAQASTRQAYQLFVLHDADPYGYDIARTLREETERMPGYAVDVIDLGLFFDDAMAMGVKSEDFVRKKALPEALSLTETERTAFEGSKVNVGGKSQWIGQRVEINALSVPQQVGYIELQLRTAKVRGKVIPPDEVLPEKTRAVYRDVCNTYAQGALNMLLPLDEIRGRVVEQFRDAIPYDESRAWIEQALREQETLSWDRALRSKVSDLLSEKRDDIEDAVRTEVLAAAQGVLREDEGSRGVGY